MPELVAVSSIEKEESLQNYLRALFERGKYSEIAQAIGMHSILVDPEHMIGDQNRLYRIVLTLLKKRVEQEHPKTYSTWLTDFPEILGRIVKSGAIVTDAAARDALASRQASFGRFLSLENFFSWSLDDRHLPLDQLIRYVLKTVENSRK